MNTFSKKKNKLQRRIVVNSFPLLKFAVCRMKKSPLNKSMSSIKTP